MKTCNECKLPYPVIKTKATIFHRTLASAQLEARKITQATKSHRHPIWITQNKADESYCVFIRKSVFIRDSERMIEAI
jgi:hypothetical protein